MRALSYIGTEKITLPLNLIYRQTDGHTYRRTDIKYYRVASLLKPTTESQQSRRFIQKKAKRSVVSKSVGDTYLIIENLIFIN